MGGLLWPEPLAAEEADRIRSRIEVTRAAKVVHYMNAVFARGGAGETNLREAALISALERLAARDSQAASGMVKHWSLPVLLGRALKGLDQSAKCVDVALGSIVYTELLARLQGEVTVHAPATQFKLAAGPGGWIAALTENGRFRFKGIGEGTLSVQIDNANVHVQNETSNLSTVFPCMDYPRPVWLEFDFLPKPENCEVVAIVEDPYIAAAFVTAPPQAHQAPNGGIPLSLAESISLAVDFISDTFPSALDWLRVLTPAIIRLNRSGASRTRLSGSFGAGLPIHLSQVEDPWFHAEDLVHELQHQRFNYLVHGDHWFGRWNDKAPKFLSPYRADPRPLSGLHLGLHAFIAVNELRLRRTGHMDDNASWFAEILQTHLHNVFSYRSAIAHEDLGKYASAYYTDVVEALWRQQLQIDEWCRRSNLAKIKGVLEKQQESWARATPYLQNSSGQLGLLRAFEVTSTDLGA
ncbi:HEXXH motif-containing putative peptide modification protein [Mesorhizobium sp. M0408]|uniref:aKG-HExxH-type peptide beta-hydroxylase n=1 Tax=Mesorhizobium sp. M0408 TaxID=2956942 RepID=UPI00333DF782